MPSLVPEHIMDELGSIQAASEIEADIKINAKNNRK